MTFNSLPFLLFFPIVFIIYWGLVRRRRWQNALLLMASYLFYGWWDWRYLSLLIGVTISTYVTSRLAERCRPKLFTAINVMVCLLTLATFKYFNFFSENLQWLFSIVGWNLDWFTLNVLLPVGISFYTFQAIGYSVDVYRREIRPERNPANLALFLSYFPQLVAGPIEKASSLMPQLKSSRSWCYPMAVDGARQALWGMFKKVVIADTLALYVDGVMAAPAYYMHHAPGSVIIALLVFTVVIYCDFSGYCDIARGVSRTLGIELTQNFRYPLFARNVRQRWQRWNVSLMYWFRSYVYFPLGGSRCSRFRASLNVVIVFLISGLWHGAAWTFVIWGAYWGVVTAVSRFFPRQRVAWASPYSGIPFTLALTALSYVFFRSQSLPDMLLILPWAVAALASLALCAEAMVLNWWRMRPQLRRAILWPVAIGAAAALVGAMIIIPAQIIPVVFRWLPVFWVGVMLLVEWRARHLAHALQSMPRGHVLRMAIYICLVIVILTSTAETTAFIYFQF